MAPNSNRVPLPLRLPIASNPRHSTKPVREADGRVQITLIPIIPNLTHTPPPLHNIDRPNVTFFAMVTSPRNLPSQLHNRARSNTTLCPMVSSPKHPFPRQHRTDHPRITLRPMVFKPRYPTYLPQKGDNMDSPKITFAQMVLNSRH